MENQTNIVQEKSEILFLYESNYSIPNGDPFTGEQRYDEETKKILVSDVRMKRFIRDYLENGGEHIYVSNQTEGGDTDAKTVLKWIAQNRNPNNKLDVGEIMKEQIDVRLFGGISTLGDDAKQIKVGDNSLKNGHVQFTGPVQFSMLNPSMNSVNLRMHQNTSHFKSSAEKQQGSIGTTTVVPYAMNQIHGWINPQVAEQTGLSEDDLKKMFKGLWYGTSGDGSSHSRSKIGQNSVLLLQIVYSQSNQKIYGIDRLIEAIGKNGKSEEQWRGMEDFDLKFDKLIEKIDSEKVSKVRYYTEIPEIEEKLSKNKKFEKLTIETE